MERESDSEPGRGLTTLLEARFLGALLVVPPLSSFRGYVTHLVDAIVARGFSAEHYREAIQLALSMNSTSRRELRRNALDAAAGSDKMALVEASLSARSSKSSSAFAGERACTASSASSRARRLRVPHQNE